MDYAANSMFRGDQMTITDEIKARLDIVDLLSQYINLKKAGRNYTALCPFHAEETPSFVVFPESQTWRCFGSCSVSGDIIDFVMRVEGTVFDNTVRSLAQRVGIDLQGQELELEEQYVDRLDN